jgi:hypothetical protein
MAFAQHVDPSEARFFDVRDGSFETTISVPSDAVLGPTQLLIVLMHPLGADENLFHWVPVVFVEPATLDQTAPVWGSVSLSATTVDVSSGLQTIEVSVEAFDSGLGIEAICLEWSGLPRFGLYDCGDRSLNPLPDSGCGSLILVSGSLNGGTWQGQLAIPADTPAQTFSIDPSLTMIRDIAGNRVSYSALAGGIPDITVINQGDQGDQGGQGCQSP